MTRVLKINPNSPEPEHIAAAADVLRAGGLVAYPTETVYGLASSAFVVDSIIRVYDVKQRPFSDALPVQIAHLSDIDTLARGVSKEARRLVEEFFPGPLTLVFFRLPTISLTVTGGQNAIAIRMPDHPVALSLIHAFDAPVVCPAANLHGRRMPMTAEDVLEDLDGAIDLVLDGGPTPGRTPSTVVDMTSSPARLVRAGVIAQGELAALVAIEN